MKCALNKLALPCYVD